MSPFENERIYVKIEMFVVDAENLQELYFSRIKDADTKPENGDWNDVYIYTHSWISKKCNVERMERILGVKNTND
jgi:hypothetical protein